MKKFLVLCMWVLMAGCGLCHAAMADRAEALKHAAEITVAAYPDADSVLVCDTTVESYNPDGTGQSTNEWYEKILTEKGRRGSRTASFWMNISYGDVVVKSAEIIKPDGAAAAVDIAANSRMMTEPGQMGSNIFDPHNKILTLAITGLEIGDTLHMVVERNTKKARVPNTFSEYMVFETTSPIRKVVYEVVAPAALPLGNIRMRDKIGDGVKYETEVLEDGNTRHRWSAENVAQAFPEPDMPPLHTCAQRVLVSTVKDWRDLSRWYWKLSEPRMAATVPEMQTTVDEIVRGAKTRDEKIWSVFTYVSQKIRYMGVTPEEEAPGYEPHDVKLTFQNKYGVCRDKAALLAAMLRMAGIDAFPVLIHVGERRDPEVPQMYFNHAIVGVRSDKPGAEGAEQYILMDPTNENSARLLPEYLCEKSFLVATPEGETLLESKAMSAAENMAVIETESEIKDGWQFANTRVKLNGMNDTLYRSGLAKMRKEDRRLFAERLLQAAAPGATLTGLKITPEDVQDTAVPLAFEFEYAIPDPVITGGVSVVTLPRLADTFGYVNYLVGRTGLKERRFPLETDMPCGVEEHIAVRTGFGAGVFAGGGDVDIAESGISYLQKSVYTNGVMTSDSRFAIYKSLFTPAEYLGLRAALQGIESAKRAVPMWEDAERKRVEAEKPVQLSPEKPNDVLVLLDETEIYPENPTNAWCEVLHVRMKILTYAGKIRAGDIKLPYNPAMDEVELVSATITGPDGTVHEVTALEKNVMDQGWVASAPRYPEGKLLVVSFPGLEVGSVIDYTVRHRRFGGPFHAYTKRFGGFDDIERQTLTIKRKDGMEFGKRSWTLKSPITIKGLVGKRYRKAAEKTESPEPALPDYDLKVSERADGVTTVVCTNAPGMIREDNMPPARYVFRRSCSVLPDVDAFGYAAMIQDRMNEQAKGQPLAAKKAAELIAGMTTVAEKVRAIRDFVAKNIRAAGPAYYELPLSMLSPADVTLASEYGHDADVAILLKALLESAGLEPRFVFIDGERVIQTDMGDVAVNAYDLFDTILVAVDDGEATYYVNQGSQYGEMRATGCDGMVYADIGARAWRKLAPNEGYADSLSTHYDVDVAEDGTAVVDVTTEYRGATVDGFRRFYEEITPEDRRRHVMEVVSAYSRNAVLEGAYATDVKSYPGIRKFRMRIPRWAVREDGFMNVRLPGASSTSVVPRYGERRLPFFRGKVNRFRDTWTIRMPEGYASAELMPKENEFGAETLGTQLATRCSTERMADGRLVVKVERTADLERALFSAADYEAFMKASLKTQGRHADTVIVAR